MVSFNTKGLNRQGRWQSFPLFYLVEERRLGAQVLFDIDASLVIEEVNDSKVIRRAQSHSLFSSEKAPQAEGYLNKQEYKLLFAWYSLSYNYAQAKPLDYSPQLQQEMYSGTYNGKDLWSIWDPEDKVYLNEYLTLRFANRKNKGEPTNWELRLLLEEKQRRYNAYALNFGRNTSGAGAPAFNINDYVTAKEFIDMRLYRPLTQDKVRTLADSDVFAVTGTTETVEKVFNKMLERLLDPKDIDDIGITKGESTFFAVGTRLPQKRDAVSGAAFFQKELNRISSNIQDYIVVEPYLNFQDGTTPS